MYLHGGDYCPEQWIFDMNIVREDIQKFKAANINCVTLGMFSWSSLEPREGEFELDWLEAVLAELEANEMQVILGTPTAARPHWLAQNYRSTSRVNEVRIRENSGVRHNHCMSDPIFREKAEIIILKQLEVANKFTNIHSVHLNNEVNGYCYCDNCVGSFQRYLKQKYRTIENLNRCWWNVFWSHSYTSFSEIEPPVKYGEQSNTSLKVNWDYFTTYIHTDYINFEKAIINKNSDYLVTTNFCGTPFTTALDYYKLAKPLDYISYDVYPDWKRKNNFETAITAKKDLLSQRDLDIEKDFYIMESSPGGTDWREHTIYKSAALHEASTFLQVLCGAKSTLYFQLKQSRASNEKFHGSVMNINSDVTDRVYNYVKDYGAKLDQITAFYNAKSIKEVGIYLSWDAHIALNHSSGPRNKGLKTEALYDDLCKYFNNVNINCSFIYDHTQIANHKYIVIPYGYTLSDEIICELKKGAALKVIAFPLLNYVNSDDLLHLGQRPVGLATDFGINVREFTALEDEELISDQHYDYETLAELVELDGAEALGTFNDEVLKTSISRKTTNQTEFYYIAGIPKFESLTKILDSIFKQTYDPNDYTIKNKYLLEGREYQYLINFGEERVAIENVEWKSNQQLDNALDKYEFAIICNE